MSREPERESSPELTPPPTPRRHRGIRARGFERTDSAREAANDALRAALWEVLFAFLFAPPDAFGAFEAPADPWAGGVTRRASVRRVWSSPPLEGDPEEVPEDVADVVAGWVALAGPGELYHLVQSVHDNLESSRQARFAAACNVVLEPCASDHRFVRTRLVSIASPPESDEDRRQ